MNTAKWKYIVPKLYKEYPNEAMNLNVSLSSPPIISVSDNGIGVAIRSDVVVSVLDKGEAVPVLCVSLVRLSSHSITKKTKELFQCHEP